MAPVESINAVTLLTADMTKSVRFYDALGFETIFGGPDDAFTTFRVGTGFLNLQLDPERSPSPSVWGRVIFWVDDVDRMHRRAMEARYQPTTEPVDAPWGERFFHISDPDGHELSFARALR